MKELELGVVVRLDDDDDGIWLRGEELGGVVELGEVAPAPPVGKKEG